MGLGAFLAAVTERDHYLAEEAREREEVRTKPEEERQEIFDIMGQYGVGEEACKGLVDQLEGNSEEWVKVCLCLFSL